MSQQVATTANSGRLHYLDWLRVIIILGVVVAHVFLPFAGGDWLISSDQLLFSATIIAIVGNQFGMPLLFLISGAGVGFALRKRTAGRFINERFQRLIIPYIIGVIFLSPIQAYYSALNHGTYSGNFISFLPNFFNLDGFGSFDFRWAGYYGYHLWFLVFLFVYSVVGLPLFLYLKSGRGKWLYNVSAAICRIPGGTLVFALPVALTQILLRAPFPAYQSWADFAFWGMFFIYGYIFFTDDRLRKRLIRDGIIALIVIILSFLLLLFLGMVTFVQVANVFSLEEFSELLVNPDTVVQDFINSPTFRQLYIFGFTLLSLNTWAFLIVFIWLGHRFLNFTNHALEKLSDIALPIYLIHHPVVIILGFYVVALEINPRIEVLILLVSVFSITIGTIEWFVSPYDPIRKLLGMRSREKSHAAPVTHLLIKQGGMIVGVLLLVFGLNILMQNAPAQADFVTEDSPPPEGWEVIKTDEPTKCVDGTPYQFFVHQDDPAQLSDNLMIYFQGGGACWNAETCAPSSLALDRQVTNRELDTYGGIFDLNNPANPISDYDAVMVSYCTGDVHTGTEDVVYEDAFGNELLIHHQGYINATTVLDWVYDTYESPEKILITGSSAGALGAIFHAADIIEQYEDSDVTVFGDGFVGVMTPFWTGPEKWGTYDNVPESIAQEVEGSTPDHFVNDLYLATAETFPQQQYGQFTHASDIFQIAYYNIAHGRVRDWPDLMNQNIEELNDNLDNFRSFITPGFLHTILAFDNFYTNEVDGLLFRDWFAGLLDGEPVENIHCDRGAASCP